jgi:hypothetical protein
MSVTKTIGSNSYKIPQNLETAGWGEDFSAAIQALIDKVNSVSSNNDILPATATITNNTSSNTAVTGLNFNSSLVNGAEVIYYVTRTNREFGRILVMYDGSTWKLTQGPKQGKSGVVLDIDSTGQVVYQSTNDIDGTISFTAKAYT